MDKLILSQSGVYRLQQLASQFHHLTGVRHKLSNNDDMIDLLRDCASSKDKVIQTYFAAFTNELGPEQVNSLVAMGVQPQNAPSSLQTH